MEDNLNLVKQCIKRQLNILVGYTVVQATISNSGISGVYEVYPGLLMRNEEGEEKIIWFLRDEEDNGSGWFDIQERP